MARQSEEEGFSPKIEKPDWQLTDWIDESGTFGHGRSRGSSWSCCDIEASTEDDTYTSFSRNSVGSFHFAAVLLSITVRLPLGCDELQILKWYRRKGNENMVSLGIMNAEDN